MNENWFVGIPITEATWFDERFDAPASDLWRVNPHDLHLSVAFLGAVGEEQARAAFRHTGRWKRGPIEASLGAIVPLGKSSKYGALVGLLSDGNSQAIQLIKTLRPHMLREAGVSPQEGEPLPHITVMRAKRRAPRVQRQAGLEWARQLDLTGVPLVLRKMALYTWREDRSVRRYRRVDTWELEPRL